MSLKSTVSVMAMGWIACSAPALAQEVAGRSAQSETPEPQSGASGLDGEIIVTAQKRSERLSDVPLAISAIGSNDLASRGITDTAQLTKVVPTFNVLKSAYGQPIFYIRGVGFADVTVSISPAVSVYSDEIPVPFSTMARGAALDLERVEVLKGPQGTLFGQNSTGGAVNYIGAKPTGDLQAGTDLLAGRFGQINASAFVSGPISDTLSARIAVEQRYQGDWQRSISRGEERGQQRFYNGRFTLDWQPADQLKFVLTASAWKDRSDNQSPQFVYFAPARTGATANQMVTTILSAQVPAPDSSRLADWDEGTRTAKDDRFYQLAFRGDYELPSATLTSISAYSDARINSPVDVDGTPFQNAFYDQVARLKTFSQEIRLASDGAGRLKWMVGGNYQSAQTDELLDQHTNITNNVVGPLTYDHVKVSDDQRVRSYAGFASLDYKLTDALNFRASGRYTAEHRNFQGCLADGGNGAFAAAFSIVETALAGQPVTIAPGACATMDDATNLPLPIVEKSLNENNFSWRVGLDWKANPSTLLYVNVAKGYKSGGFTAVPAVFAQQLSPVTQESVLAYEGGLKSALFDRRIQFNASIFYYEYKNKQLQGYVNIVPFGPLPRLINIPTSRVFGLEGDITADISSHLRFRLAGSYLDTKATSSPVLPISPLGGTYDFSGESFPNTPKYQLTADLEQRIPLGGGAEAYLGGSMQYRSRASGVFGRTQSALTDSLFTIDGYTLLDLRVGLSFADQKATVELWGRNITNKFYVVGITRAADVVARYIGMPATYGVRFSWRY